MSYIMYLTSDCNMKCKYCYEQNSRNKLENKISITYDEIKKQLDDIYNNFNSDDNCLVLFGGEPTLEIDKIKYIIDYNNKQTNKLVFHMNTNGLLLLNDKIYKFITELINNGILYMSISYDGSGQDNRILINNKSSKKLIDRVLNKLNKDNIPIFISYVITELNYKNIIKDTIYLIKKYNNITKITFAYNYSEMDKIINIQEHTDYIVRYFVYLYKKYHVSLCIPDNKKVCNLCKKCNVSDLKYIVKDKVIERENKLNMELFNLWD